MLVSTITHFRGQSYTYRTDQLFPVIWEHQDGPDTAYSLPPSMVGWQMTIHLEIDNDA